MSRKRKLKSVQYSRHVLLLAGLILLSPGCKDQPPPVPMPPREVVLIVGNRQNPFDAALIASAQNAVESEINTIVQVIEANPTDGRKPDTIKPTYRLAGILLACLPSEALNQQIGQAAKLGTRIFAIGNLFSIKGMPGADWQPELTIAPEVHLAGSECVRALIRRLEQDTLIPKGTEAVILYSNTNDYATSLRKRGMSAALLVTPANIQALQPVEITGTPQQAQAAIEDLLRKHPQLGILLCTQADLLLAAVQAGQTVRPRHPPAIGGFEATLQTRDALKTGKIHAIVDLRPDILARRATVFALNQGSSAVSISARIPVLADVLTPETLDKSSSKPATSGPAARP